MRAFILAAGLGTRLQPLTENKPKALVEINGKTLLQLTINKLKNTGFDHIIINVHHFAEQIIDYLQKNNYFDVDIRISNEKDMLLDTGGGLKRVSWFFESGGPFLVHNVDIISELNIMQLFKFHLNENPLATLAVQNRISSRYFIFDEDKTLCGWTNHKTGKTIFAKNPKGTTRELAFSGIHIASPAVFNFMPDKDVFSIVELYLSIASENRITYFEHTGSYFLDLGRKENLLEAEKYLSNKS